jgi:hypothetical protein
MLASIMSKTEQFHASIYEDGARIADEVLTLIRTVKLFNAVEKEALAYRAVVQKAAQKGRNHGVQFGISLALTDPMEFFLCTCIDPRPRPRPPPSLHHLDS